MKTPAIVKQGSKAEPKAPVRAKRNLDGDATGGDDADDKDLPDLHNDEKDESSQKRDHEERFAKEQRRDSEKTRELGARRGSGPTPRARAAARLSGAVGIWIDGRKAIVVASGAQTPHGAAAVLRITTNLEGQLRMSSGERAKTSYGPQSEPSDDMRETSSQDNLRKFFDEVISAVLGAGVLYIFGPGEAKEEFKKRLEKVGFGARIDSVETAGKLSDRQVAAKVREHFSPRV
jgi:hypothetical protein